MVEKARKQQTSVKSCSAAGCEKAADFVNFCDAFSIPVLSLTDVAGYAASKCEEKKIAKAAAKLTYAFASATVPESKRCNRQGFRKRLYCYELQGNRRRHYI